MHGPELHTYQNNYWAMHGPVVIWIRILTNHSYCYYAGVRLPSPDDISRSIYRTPMRRTGSDQPVGKAERRTTSVESKAALKLELELDTLAGERVPIRVPARDACEAERRIPRLRLASVLTITMMNPDCPLSNTS